jgi:hypothetical protein
VGRWVGIIFVKLEKAYHLIKPRYNASSAEGDDEAGAAYAGQDAEFPVEGPVLPHTHQSGNCGKTLCREFCLPKDHSDPN